MDLDGQPFYCLGNDRHHLLVLASSISAVLLSQLPLSPFCSDCAAVDFYFALLPWIFIWNLNMNFKEKMSLYYKCFDTIYSW
ncbi:hypothetical protein N7491_004218 [Penicillium cf. griseofulvum]|uniref:Uncharacterized protein n=1 Tax=Penicillium cf. griseofulvum TaxID=2972120 RepID=A0A9W9T0Q9_9EURO|nr:hypothetical protein N7472_001607 [Penicillium cf. griseofulvum]KAJ5441812.1 hypothetical protein N7491_004218 [Penicillium cf. griseofulvum]